MGSIKRVLNFGLLQHTKKDKDNLLILDVSKCSDPLADMQAHYTQMRRKTSVIGDRAAHRWSVTQLFLGQVLRPVIFKATSLIDIHHFGTITAHSAESQDTQTPCVAPLNRSHAFQTRHDYVRASLEHMMIS